MFCTLCVCVCVSQDTEMYKASVKDDMLRWQSTLRLHGSVDWLIVVVESEAKKKNKTNILPRTSIVDKIRNDFCNKQSDRSATSPLLCLVRTESELFCLPRDPPGDLLGGHALF